MADKNKNGWFFNKHILAEINAVSDDEVGDFDEETEESQVDVKATEYIDSLAKQLKDAEKEKTELRARKIQAETQRLSDQEELEKAKAMVKRLSEEKSNRWTQEQQQKQMADAKIARVNDELLRLQLEMADWLPPDEAQECKKVADARVQEVQKECDQLNLQIEVMQTKFQQKEVQLQEVEAQLQQRETEGNEREQQLVQQIEQLTAEVEELQEIIQVREEVGPENAESLETQLAELQAAYEAMSQNLGEVTEERGQLKVQLELMTAVWRQKKEEVSFGKEQVAQNYEEIQRTVTVLDQKEAELAQLRLEHKKLIEEVQLFKNNQMSSQADWDEQSELKSAASQHEIGEVLIEAKRQANATMEEAHEKALTMVQAAKCEVDSLRQLTQKISEEVSDSHINVNTMYNELERKVLNFIEKESLDVEGKES